MCERRSSTESSTATAGTGSPAPGGMYRHSVLKKAPGYTVEPSVSSTRPRKRR